MNMEDYKRTVYVDMDGVLADFDEGFYNISGGLNTESISESEMWARIEAYGKSKFFSELPWIPGSKEMWSFLIDNFLHVKILSALGKSDATNRQTTQGKTAWLRHHLPALRTDDIILVENKHRKQRYSKPGDIIIDDTEVVIQEWNRKGGIGILFKTAPDVINQLKRYV
jgi:5'-nucleotidase